MTKRTTNTVGEPVTAEAGDEALVEEMALAEIAGALAEKEPLWLDDKWEATCPVPGYEGRIKYPPVMGLDRYKRWRKMTDEADDDDREMTLAFVFVGESQRTSPFFFSLLYYQLAAEFATVAIAGKDGKLLNLSDTDNLPVSLVAWLALTAKYWLENQLTFRVSSR